MYISHTVTGGLRGCNPVSYVDAQSTFKHQGHTPSMPASTLLAKRNLAEGKKKIQFNLA